VTAFALHAERRAAEPLVILDHLVTPLAVAVRDDNVYVTSFEGAQKNIRVLLRAPISGGAPLRLAQSPMGTPSIAIDESHVYWTSYGSRNLLRVAKGGGASSVVSSQHRYIQGLALDAGHVYFSDRVADKRGILRAPKQGGSATVVAPDLPVVAFALHAGSLYATVADGVVKLPAAGGPITRLVSGEPRASLLAVGGEGVFFVAGPERHSVRHVAHSGGEVMTLAKVPGRIVALTVAGTSVFLATQGELHAVMKVPAQGGPVVPIADLKEPTDLAVHDTSLFVTAGGPRGRLLRIDL
jgi:hypothetical protein